MGEVPSASETDGTGAAKPGWREREEGGFFTVQLDQGKIK
jgi:hypothetical protein